MLGPYSPDLTSGHWAISLVVEQRSPKPLAGVRFPHRPQFFMKSQVLQLTKVHSIIDALHKKHGDENYAPIYGTGCVLKPKIVLVFMNPTARNISVHKNWQGIRAPWVGLKQTWKLFYEIGILKKELFDITQKIKPEDWTPELADNIYKYIAGQKIFSTNLAKATISDARPLLDKVFYDSRAGFLEELRLLKATHVITFGNQVSSVLLDKAIKVGEYSGTKCELLVDGQNTYHVYPCFYPIGRGWMNVKKVILRIRLILRSI